MRPRDVCRLLRADFSGQARSGPIAVAILDPSAPHARGHERVLVASRLRGAAASPPIIIRARTFHFCELYERSLVAKIPTVAVMRDLPDALRR